MDEEISLVDQPEWSLVSGQLGVLEKLGSASKAAPSQSHSPFFPLLDAIHESTETLLDLARGGRKVRDSYVIARVVYETSVNACFVAAGGEPAAERARRHARQKSLRDLERYVKVADKEFKMSHSAAPSALADPENQRLLAEFTSKAGRELTAWTPENIRERLESVCARFGSDEAVGLIYGLLLYRHSSDIAHGTLFGALFGYGATDPKGPPKSLDDLEYFRHDQLRLVLMLVGFSLKSLIRVVGTELGEAQLVEHSNRIDKAFRTRPRKGAGA